MAKPYRLNQIEKEHGVPLEQIIPPLVNIGGQGHAARVLGVSQSTISEWLRENGYIKKEQYIKVAEPQ